MPISTCIKEVLTLPKNRGGFGIPTTLHLYKKLSLVKRSALRSSARPEIRQVWTDTSAKNIATDSLLCSSDGLSEAKKSLKSSLILQAESHRHSLVLQCQAIQVIVDCVPKSGIEQWSRVVEALPDFLFRFVKKALQQQLPTASNLARWKRIPSPDCMLCKKSIHQTNKHLLSNCESLLECYSETTQQNSWEDCSMDRFKQVSGTVVGGRSPIFDIPSYWLGLQADDQTGYRTVR